MTTIIDELQLGFDDVRILPQKTFFESREDANLLVKFNKLPKPVIPVICANMSCATFTMARELAKYNMMTALHKYHSLESLLEFWNNDYDVADSFTFYTMGITEEDKNKFTDFIAANGSPPDNICIDVANGNMVKLLKEVKEIRKHAPDALLMVGNTVNGDVARQLIVAGADIIKAGISMGANCLTSKITGVGRPQLSTVLEVSNALHTLFNAFGKNYSDYDHFLKTEEYQGLICSDGGCSEIGHINIAFAAGSNFTMIGTLLAGTDECEGEIIEKDGKQYKEFFGMSSHTARKKYSNSNNYKTSEGRTTLIPYKGPVKNILEDIVGGMKSMLSYVGAFDLQDLSEHAKLIRVTQSINRSHEKYTIGN